MNKPQSSKESIAIIGMSCRFPQASSLDEFWELLKGGKDTITEIPRERWDIEKYYDPDPFAEQKTNQRHASLLSAIHDFDPLFFNISPAEASEMSPSQKLMLELAWEAIENSTVPFNEVKGHNVGVYVGTIWADFEHYRKMKNARTTSHSAVGMSSNVVANRVSFALGFTGPSLAIDTGCSASLVALHLACQSLLNNETEMSVVGGINHLLDPDKYIQLTRFGGLSGNGKCSAFDNDADGFVRGEGGGVVVLKRLSEAERDGNKIYAVIRGSAVNNNGFNDTLPATSTEGQKALLEKVYREAGINPGEVHYIEAHGTGTKLGDPNEARAIGEFFREGRNGTKLRVGSVKTNIGHTEATAGIAGLIKVVLAMQHKTLPANLNFRNPNTNIAFDDLKIEVQKELTHWPVHNGETFKAGVNSFGWGGTNAHTVLEEYRSEKKTDRPEISARYCLPLSAKSSQALKAYARAYANQLEQCDEASAQAMCVATALRKPEFDHRQLFTGNNRQELLDSLHHFIADDSEVMPSQTLDESPKIVFVFPGQGGQWLGMGRSLLLKENVFRKSIEECDAAFRKYTDWSLLDQLNASDATSRLKEINVIQPAICAMQIALAKLWMSWGINPQVVVGHSMGEVAAAYISGALTLDDAARIICTRSILMKTVSGKGGAMAVTELSREEAEKVAAAYPGKLSVAVNNSPKSTVLAGDKSSIDEVIADLESKGLFCRLVKVDVASHSPQMEPLMEPLRNELQNVAPQKTSVPFFSTVLNKVMTGTDMGADYWVSNLRGMVQFASVVENLLEGDYTVFIEANPHPVLVNALNECAESGKKKITTLASLYREKPESEELMKNLSEFYAKGYTIPWSAFLGTKQIPDIDLPPYPFQRESFDVEVLEEEESPVKTTSARFPLLGEKINLASASGTYYWESALSLNKFPYLRDHVIHDRIELPVSCYIEMALEAMEEIGKGNGRFRIEELTLTKYLVLTEKQTVDIQVKLEEYENQTGKITIFRKEHSGWEQLAEGSIAPTMVMELPARQKTFERIEYHAHSYTEGGSYYNLLRSIGQQYGKHFQQITGLDRMGLNPFANVLFSISPDQQVSLTAGNYQVHPALMSSFFQPVFVQLTTLMEEGNSLEVRFTKIGKLTQNGAVNYSRELRGLLAFRALQKQKDSQGTWNFSADITIANHDNTEVMSITGLEGVAQSKAYVRSTNVPRKEAAGLADSNAISADSEEALEQMIIYHVAKIIKSSPARIKRTMAFKSLGVDSLMAVQLRNALEKNINLKLSVAWFWSHPTIKEYATFLWSRLTEDKSVANDSTSASASLERQIRNRESAAHSGKASNWLVITKPQPKAKARIFCFHDAGGSSSLFDQWSNQLDSSFELVAVELPGRGQRLDEEVYTNYRDIITDVVPQMLPLLDKPYAIAGHSMGAILALEVARALRRKNARVPLYLMVSSAPAPSVYNGMEIPYQLDEQELVGIFPHIDAELINDAEMQQLLVKRLRSDLRILNSYQYVNEEKLTIPVVALHGKEDLRILKEGVEAWEKETSGSFQFISRPGGHGFVEKEVPFMTKLIFEKYSQNSTLVVAQ